MMSYSPVKQVPGEIRGTLQRADYMLSIAEKALKDVTLTDTDQPGFRRYIKRVPLGVVLVIAPWKCVSLPERVTHHRPNTVTLLAPIAATPT